MKQIICFMTIMGAMLLCSTNALAGSVPEDLLDDKSLLFFGELISYDTTNNQITILPTQKIKGAVNVGTEQLYTDVCCAGNNFTPVRGRTYLMSYYDENNPLYIFKITGADTKTLEIEGIDADGMWGRMQKNLNEGLYEQREAERLSKINGLSASSVITPTPVPTPTYKSSSILQYGRIYYFIYGIVAAAIICGVILFLRKQKRKK